MINDPRVHLVLQKVPGKFYCCVLRFKGASETTDISHVTCQLCRMNWHQEKAFSLPEAER